ncbi:class I SAM-dependent methyltransferase [Actinomyces ruminicola]|uniref:class I SAM-dependent DNA methyltransferase n=1 Tax=Actinomyces ruminicola TaxID=332524 RepID=UPI0011CC4276|nr:class I SAM-dependent methyltransferase [Actinomyces ruminicola]
MDGFEPSTFGDAIADIYDEYYRSEVEPTPEKLAVLDRLAAGGAVLDVGCGTGRMAVALSQRGLSVTGVDVSQAMLDKLAQLDKERKVRARLLDVTRETIRGSYSLAYLLFETFIMLGGRAAQESALRNIASSLVPGGAVLLEFSVFEVDGWFERGFGSVRVSKMGVDYVALGMSTYDREAQRLDYQDVLITERGIRLLPLTMFPTLPHELEKMASRCGLRKEAHWADWAGTRFGRGMPSLVAVYRKS